MDISNKIFRLRSSSALLDEFNELENQEIFMAEPESLNDPMEGFIRYLWDGNICDWNNLVRNYLICLEHMITLAYVIDKDDEYLKIEIPVFKTMDHYPTEKYKKLMEVIIHEFYKADGVHDYINFISTRKSVNEDELKVFLKTLNSTAIWVINNEHYKKGFISKEQSLRYKPKGIKKFTKILSDGQNTDNFEDIYKILITSQKEIIDEINLITYCNASNIKQRLLVTEFVDNYIKSIKQMTCSDTYLSCFMNNYTNSAMWGYYGDKHEGICLIFKVSIENDKKKLKLNNRKYVLESVSYEDFTPEVNFF